jgi:hypothetical protein
VAGTLWSEVPEDRSYASLRSALTRLDRASRKTLQVSRARAQRAALPLSRRGGDQRGHLGTDSVDEHGDGARCLVQGLVCVVVHPIR